MCVIIAVLPGEKIKNDFNYIRNNQTKINNDRKY